MNLQPAFSQRFLIASVLAVWATFGFDGATAIASVPAQNQFKIVIVDGNGAVNTVGKTVQQQVSVRVDDAMDKPVSGASVFFQMPIGQGPGGSIAGQRAVSIVTDNAGLAKITFQPNRNVGTFKIEVTANFQGLSASSSVTQINEQSGVNGSGHGKLWAVLGGGAAAVVAAVVVGNRSSSSTSSSTTTTPTTSTTPTPQLSVAMIPSVGTGGGLVSTSEAESALNGTISSIFHTNAESCTLQAGSTLMNFTTTTSGSWFAVSPTSGTIPAGGSTAIGVTSLSATSLPSGLSNGFVTISAPGYQPISAVQFISINCQGGGGTPTCTVTFSC